MSDGSILRQVEETLAGRGLDNRWLSIEEVAAKFGRCVRTIERWSAEPGAPKRYQRSRKKMFREGELTMWAERAL